MMLKDAGGARPVPDTPKETVSPGTPPDTLEVIVPLVLPAGDGVNTTIIWQLARV